LIFSIVLIFLGSLTAATLHGDSKAPVKTDTDDANTRSHPQKATRSQAGLRVCTGFFPLSLPNTPYGQDYTETGLS
jgi:hypothetical protein